MDYQTYLESIGCSQKEIKRMVENHPRHFGDDPLEYKPSSGEVEDDAEAITD
jgi:hypothetical protein